MRSKVIFGHQKWPPAAILREYFPKKLKLCIDLKWREMRSKVIFGHPKWPPAANLLEISPKKIKLRIDLKWRDMRSKVIFGHQKWPPAAILREISKKMKVAYWSEMARNAIKSYFWSSKMAAGRHFARNFKKKSCVLIWNGEKCDKKLFLVIQNFVNKIKKKLKQQNCVLIWNAIKSDFRSSKMAAHFVKKKKLRIDLKWWEMQMKVIFGHPKWPSPDILK